MKALKKMKVSKHSSSNGNMFAMVFIVFLFLVIVFQGMSSNSTPVSFQGSPLSAGPTEGSLISVQYCGNPFASYSNWRGSSHPSEYVTIHTKLSAHWMKTGRRNRL